MTVERIQSPWIQPGGRPDRDNDPQGVFLPFAPTDMFFACSKAAIFSFTMAVKCPWTEQRRQE